MVYEKSPGVVPGLVSYCRRSLERNAAASRELVERGLGEFAGFSFAGFPVADFGIVDLPFHGDLNF